MAHVSIEIEVTSEIVYQDGHTEVGPHKTHYQSIAYSENAAKQTIRIADNIVSKLHIQ